MQTASPTPPLDEKEKNKKKLQTLPLQLLWPRPERLELQNKEGICTLPGQSCPVWEGWNLRSKDKHQFPREDGYSCLNTAQGKWISPQAKQPWRTLSFALLGKLILNLQLQATQEILSQLFNTNEKYTIVEKMKRNDNPNENRKCYISQWKLYFSSANRNHWT